MNEVKPAAAGPGDGSVLPPPPRGKRFQLADQVVTTLKGHKGCVYQVKFNRSGEYAMSCSSDRNIILWNPMKGTLVKQFSGIHNYEVYDVVISGDNSRFASVGGDKSVFYWDVKGNCIIRKFEGHISRINTVSFNDDESVLVSGSYDSTVRLWDLKAHSYKPLDVIKHCKDSVSKVIVNKHEILVSSIDGKVRTFDLRMGLSTTDDMKSPVHSFSLSNDGKTYAASCADGFIRLVDRDRGEILNTFQGHSVKDYQTSVLHSYDDAHIVQASEDGQVYYYDILQTKPVKVIRNHSKPVVCMSLSPVKENILLTGSFDSTITVWKAGS